MNQSSVESHLDTPIHSFSLLKVMFLGGTVSVFSRLGRRTNPQRLPRDLVLIEITAEGPRSKRAAITWTPRAAITWTQEDDDKVVMEEEEEDLNRYEGQSGNIFD